MTNGPGEFTLRTQQFDTHHFLPDTAEEALYSEYMRGLRDEVAEMLLEPVFDPNQAVGHLHAAVDRQTPTILVDRVRREAGRRSEKDKLVTMRLGEAGLLGEGLQTLRPPADFVEDLHHQIDALPYDFSELAGYHATLLKTPGLALARHIDQLYKTGIPEWKDEVFDALEAALEHFEDYALPHQSVDALYLLTFLPGYARQFTRRLISNATMLAHMKTLLGPDLRDDEVTMLAAFTKHFKARSMDTESWSNFPPTINEAHQVRLAAIKLDDMSNLATIQRLSKERKGTGVIRSWQTICAWLDVVVSEAASNSDHSAWQTIDIGHGFENFQDLDLMHTIGEDEQEREFAEPLKTGEKAIILEDDPTQMARYRSFIEDRTRFSISDGLCFATPEEIMKHAADPGIKLFVLDMQNGDDTMAGVKLAEQIIALRLNIDQPTYDRANKTRIIVWTASAQLYKAASQHLRPQLERSNVDYSVQGIGHSGRGNLMVDVRLKGWSVHDLENAN